MLYGHKEMVDNRVATLVTSGDTIEEYDAFLNVVRGQDPSKRNFNEMYTSKALQHMVEELYKGFKKPIHVFYHNDEAQRDAFVTEWNVKVLENGVQSRDKQEDMVFEKKKREENIAKHKRDEAEAQAEAAGIEYTGDREKTLAEMFGLETNDPWDRRSEEEREEDREMKKMMQQAKQAGTMSDDSFAAPPQQGQAAPTQTDSNGKLTITDTDGIINADGTLNISNIRAVKTGGPVDENLKKAREEAFDKNREEKLAGRKTFSPEDFAAVLAGDGSADHLGIKGDREVRQGSKPIDRPGLSPAAEEARQEIADAEQNAVEQTKAENDFKSQQERDKGVFRGSDLFGEDDEDIEDLDEALQHELRRIGIQDNSISVKDYPFNSQLNHKSILPFDNWGGQALMNANGAPMTAIVSTVNVKVEGTITMGESGAAIMSRIDESKDGWVIYQRTGGRLGRTVVTSVVKIR